MYKIRVSGITEESVVDGPGIRFTIFTQGCRHHCEGCHNPQTHPINEGGYFVELDELIIKIKQNPLLFGVTLTGGEPFLQAKQLAIFAKKIKDMGLTVVTYTGFTFEEILNISKTNLSFKDLLYFTDILVDGKFVKEMKSLSLKYRGSKNQRVIDVKSSLENLNKNKTLVPVLYTD